METEDTSAGGLLYTIAMNAHDTLKAITAEAKQAQKTLAHAQHTCQQLLWNISEYDADNNQERLDHDSAVRLAAILTAADKALSTI